MHQIHYAYAYGFIFIFDSKMFIKYVDAPISFGIPVIYSINEKNTL